MPGLAARLHLPYPQWPAEDRRLWERAVGDDDPFGDAAGGHLSVASRKAYLMAWRRFLGFLAIEEAETLDLAPTERLILDRMRRFATHLAKTNRPQSVASQVDMVYKAARIMMPERDWNWLKDVKARLYMVPPTPRSIKPVITSAQLLELGMQLMDETQRAPGTRISLCNAVQYRDGLMIAVLAFMPMRRKNVTALAVDHHLVRGRDGWFVVISGEETKTGSAIEFAVPDALQPYLEGYLSLVRPRLLGNRTCPDLWVSAKGCALSYSAIGPIISRHSEARLGLHVAPHDVRDAAATLWAIAAPARIGVTRDLLAHADLRTTTKHYNRARGIEASRAYAKRISEIRNGRRSTY